MSDHDRADVGTAPNDDVAQVHVFIIDRHPCTIDGLIGWLSSAGYTIGDQATSLDALDRIAQSFASLDKLICIVGPNLKPCHAFAACRRMRKHNPQARVVYLAPDAADPHTKSDAAYAGALACLPGEITPEGLLAVLPIVLTGSSLIPPDALQAQPEPLSPRELDVLRLIAQGKSDAEVALKLRIAETTLKTHVRRILTKLDEHSRDDAICRATNLGWIEQADEQNTPPEDTKITATEDRQRLQTR